MRTCLLGLPVLLCLACVQAPPTVTPEIGVEVPEAWTSPADVAGAVEGEWWRAFDDPRLDAIVRIALEENTDLIAAAARVQRAAAEARIAGADLRPSVGVGLDASRQRFNLATFGQDVPALDFNRYGLSLDVAWEVDLWGRLRAGARAAVAQAQAADADLAAARLSLAARTAKAWFAVGEARQQIELAASRVESFRRLSEQVRQRYEMGIRPPLDLRLALSNQAGAEALLHSWRQQLDRATRQLEILLARYPAATLLEEFPNAGLPELPPPVPAGLPAEIVSRRPDLVAAERRLVSSDEGLRAARRALYPRLSLTGNAGTLGLEIGNLLDGDFGVWTLAAGLVQPIFQGGRLRAGVDRAAAGSQEALALYVGAVLDAFGDVEAALAAESYLNDRVEAVREFATQTLAAEQLAEGRYREGLGDYLVVLESQTRALTAESELLTLRRALLDNRIDLHLALGGGFDYPAPGSPEGGTEIVRSARAGRPDER